MVLEKVIDQSPKQIFSRVRMRGEGKLSKQLATVVCCLGLLPVLAFSQEVVSRNVDIQELQKNIDVFSGLLEETLGLNQSAGPFSRSLSSIESSYLFAQGTVLELRHPLASRRNRMGFASLNSAMQALQARRIPFGPVPETNIASQTATSAFSSRSLAVRPQTEALSAEAADFYTSMMDRIASVDYSLIVNNAVQQASNSARSLRVLEGVDEETYLQIREQLENLRREAVSNQQQLREFLQQLEEEAVGNAVESPVAEQSTETAQADGKLASGINEIYSRLEPLRDAAVSLAEDLRQQAEQAEKDYIAQWQLELQLFEDELYQAMCDYGATLRDLPEEERVSVILKGLGDENEENRLADKVHVFSKSDISACQSGNIDVATLRARSVQYSY